jgi:hypothetical protein
LIWLSPPSLLLFIISTHFKSFQDVIGRGSRDYSPIHRKLYIFINNNQFNKYIQVLHIVSLYMKTIVGVSRDAMKQL